MKPLKATQRGTRKPSRPRREPGRAPKHPNAPNRQLPISIAPTGLGTPKTNGLEAIDRLIDRIRSFELTARIVEQAGRGLVFPRPEDIGASVDIAVLTLMEMDPQNLTEAMVAAQMVRVNDAAHMFLARATQETQHLEVIATYVNLGARLGRLFLEQIEAMQKLKGKAGQQRVVVEHVNVQAGGQAIVGAVTARPGLGVRDGTEKQQRTP